jgi:hypothetical protein
MAHALQAGVELRLTALVFDLHFQIQISVMGCPLMCHLELDLQWQMPFFFEHCWFSL